MTVPGRESASESLESDGLNTKSVIRRRTIAALWTVLGTDSRSNRRLRTTSVSVATRISIHGRPVELARPLITRWPLWNSISNMTSIIERPETGGARTTERIQTALARLTAVLEETAPTAESTAAIAEIGDVVEEAGLLVESVDLESLPDVVVAEELPNLIDVDGLPEALENHDVDAALDLDTIRDAVRLRELWNAVDLVGFAEHESKLEDELADVIGDDRFDGAGDADAVAAVRTFVDEIRPEATTAATQQQAQKLVGNGREALVSAHETVEDRYVRDSHRRTSRNPTAVSLMPSGPLPASVSTRVSTVPDAVRGAKIDPLPRVYSRRWRTVQRGKGR